MGRCSMRNRVHQIVLLQNGHAKFSFYKYSEAERKARSTGSCGATADAICGVCQAIADDFNEGSMKVFDTIFNSQVGQRVVRLAAVRTCRDVDQGFDPLRRSLRCTARAECIGSSSSCLMGYN